MGQRDPVEARADRSRDLYDIATWEPRSRLDRIAVKLYRGAVAVGRGVIILLSLAFVLGVVFLIGTNDPVVGVLTLLSAVPALGLAWYIYSADVTSKEPFVPIVLTFFLSVFFATFAGIVNTTLSFVQTLGLPGFVLFFFLVVGPVEEAVKLLAVRLYAYGSSSFDAVIDGAVYGAIAGLGFATIENALYIVQNTQMGATGADLLVQQLSSSDGSITAFRALAGPGHVIYSAFAGYYLGLAKFNRENAGPIVAKGILIAALIHATYNTLVSFVPSVAGAILGVGSLVAFFAFVVVYQGFFGYILYRKLKRYGRTYRAVQSETERSGGTVGVDSTEFDG
ncbi:PrsW family intramembrane metalloprotease [Halomarina litorea]|uniref:PrsW family intramembrane metalloprotease n=1 Tax=Halomarina litorea TaxID=2961595 RepID=UPI0020C1DB92|nr:PrsW family glutamic-type intramembrane protease [Halomarina sp. BCD28]